MYADALLWVLQKAQPDLICLAGYMRLLPAQVVQAYPMRIMNMSTPRCCPCSAARACTG
jgi:folate-dependent phosphoribosylglycinamide formyltransferase PurN